MSLWRVSISETSGLTLGASYVGNFKGGVFAFPFGFTNYF